nr:transposase (putative), gypsy type [Tanacetum cinerariifolium]
MAGLFRCFYANSKNKGWMSFSKRPGSDAVCYTKPLDLLKNWNDRFFWVDAFACLASFPWNTSKGVPKDPFSKSFEFNAEHFATLVALPAPFHKYLKPFLCLVGISRYYTLDEDAYPEFLVDNDKGMDLLAFIRIADPTKVRVVERQRAKNEPRLLESTVGRVVPLLPIAPARASSELEASVDKLFDEGASADGQGADVQPVAVTTDTIVKDVAPLQPRRQRKRKTAVADAVGPSHPPKKLREDYGALGGASIAGKSMSAVQSLFTGAVLDAEARGEPIPTLPFVTSSVSATPEREDKSPADSITGLNLQTIGAPQRFVISSDSSHHSGANIAEAKVDSVVRSSAPAIATVTTVTATIDADAMATKAPVAPCLFSVGSSSTGRTDSIPGGFLMFLVVIFLLVVSVLLLIRTLTFKKFTSRDGVQPMDLGLMTAVFFISLNAEVRMRAEYNIREKRKLRAVVDKQAELLKVKDGEIESLKAQLLLKEVEAAKAIRLRAEVFKFEAVEQSLLGEEVADLDAQVTAIKLQNDNLVGQVHELEISSAGLQEKVAAYEGFVSQLEKFQDEKLEEVNEKFDKLCANFVDMALHLKEKFYPHLLTTISGRRWLLTCGMELSVIKCLNSTEYLSALGAAISKAVEKGMQEGLSARITHGAEGRQLADVAAYNPYAEANYLSALQPLQNVNFSLIAELKSNKDASVDTIMNLLRLDDVLAERLGLTESQPHVNQLMVPIHHSPDQRVVGAFALSLSLKVSYSRVKKMRENIAKHVSALRGVFVPLFEPLSAAALEDMEGGAGVGDETAAVDMNLFSDVSNAELNISE